jgi:hypothetical protein
VDPPRELGLIAHPLTIGSGPLPAAPYETDPARWPLLDWYDRRTGNPTDVIAPAGVEPDVRADALHHGAVPIALLSDILTRYQRRIEHKSLAPDRSPAGAATRGLLARRPVESDPYQTELIGKEGNKLEERQTGEVTDPTEYRTHYGRRTSTWLLVLSVLKEIGAPETASQTEISRSAVYDVLRGPNHDQNTPANTKQSRSGTLTSG